MENSYKISAGTSLLMRLFSYAVYTVNLFIELIAGWFAVGLFLSPLFMGFAYATLGLWFTLKGVSLFQKKTGGQFVISGAISLIPIVNLIYFRLNKSGIPEPGIVALTSRVIAASREEDDAAFAASANSQEEGQYQRESFRQRANTNRYEEEEAA